MLAACFDAARSLLIGWCAVAASQTQACGVLRKLWVGRQLPFARTRRAAVVQRINEIAAVRRHRGFRGCTLLRRKGWQR
jgi:hypothetical protein